MTTNGIAMSEFKGTQGKWFINTLYQTIDDENGYGIAQENGIKNSLQWKANALLISKAPELLERLKKLVEMIDAEVPIDTTSTKRLIKEATEIN